MPLDFQSYLAQTFNASQPQGPQTVMLGQPSVPASVPGMPPPVAPAAPPVASPAPPPPMAPSGIVHPSVPLPGTAPTEFVPDPAAQSTAPGVNPDGSVAAPPQAAQAPAHPLPQLALASRGGVIPAHEVSRIGPSQSAAVNLRNRAMEEAVGRVNERNQILAVHEYDQASAQLAQAQAREAAANEAAAKQAAEMQQRQQDFDNSVKTLSQTSVDPNRFWANSSTGQKLGALVGMALGGFVQGFKGGPNVAMDAINTAIDRDIKAQEFAYNAARDTVNAKQTAFSMAMQKYQNADAARAVARAAALDTIQTQLAQNAALMKGTDAANRADMAMAALQDEKMNQSLQFNAFIQAQQAPRVFVDPRTGLRYSEADYKALVAKADERDFERERIGLQTAGDVIKEGAKADATNGKDAQARFVPTVGGKGYLAPTADEAKAHREARAASDEVRDLVAKIRADRGSFLERVGRKTTPVDTDAERRLKSNTMLLVGALNRQEKFGALDKGAQEVLQQITGNPLSIVGNDAQLSAVESNALAAPERLEKSVTGQRPSPVPEGTQGAGKAPAW